MPSAVNLIMAGRRVLILTVLPAMIKPVEYTPPCKKESSWPPKSILATPVGRGKKVGRLLVVMVGFRVSLKGVQGTGPAALGVTVGVHGRLNHMHASNGLFVCAISSTLRGQQARVTSMRAHGPSHGERRQAGYPRIPNRRRSSVVNWRFEMIVTPPRIRRRAATLRRWRGASRRVFCVQKAPLGIKAASPSTVTVRHRTRTDPRRRPATPMRGLRKRRSPSRRTGFRGLSR